MINFNVTYFDVTPENIQEGLRLGRDNNMWSSDQDDVYTHPIGLALSEPDGDSRLDLWGAYLEAITPAYLDLGGNKYYLGWGLSQWIMAFEAGERVFPVKIKMQNDKGGRWAILHRIIVSKDQQELFEITEEECNRTVGKQVSVEAATKSRRILDDMDKFNQKRESEKKQSHTRKNNNLFDQVVLMVEADPSILQGKIGPTLESVGLKANQYNRTTLNKRLKEKGLK